MVRLLGRCLPLVCLPRKKRQSLPIGEQNTNGTRHHQEEINKLFVRRVESIRVTQQGAMVKRLPLPNISERPQQPKKTKSKAAAKKNAKITKPDDTEFDCETNLSDRRSKQKHRKKSIKPAAKEEKPKSPSHPPRTPLERLFRKGKSTKQPSPSPPSIPKKALKNLDDTSSSLSSTMSSDWSTTTYPDSQSSEKSEELIKPVQRRQSVPISPLTNGNEKTKHRSCVESFYLGREHVRQPSPNRSSLVRMNNKKESPPREASSTSQTKQNELKSAAKSKQVLQNVRKMIKDQTVQEHHVQNKRQRESVRL